MARYSKNRCRWTDEQLREAVASSQSIRQVIGILGLSVTAAGNWGTVKKHVSRLGLDTSHWTGQSWVGTRENHPARLPLEQILVPGSTYRTSALRDRLIGAGLKEWRCERCLRIDWEGDRIPLEVDHANGVPDDHRIENLRLLCPNCHALTPTWRGRKNARSYHGNVAEKD